MNVTAAEIRPHLRDADLQELLASGGSFESWERLVLELAKEWHEDWTERLTFAAPEIAGRATKLWPHILKHHLDRERRDRSYAARHSLHGRDWRAVATAHDALSPWRHPHALGSEALEKMELGEAVPPGLVLDGQLVAQTLAVAIHETLAERADITAYSRLRAAGADRATATAFMTLMKVLTPDVDHEIVRLGAAASLHRTAQDVAPSPERDILTTTVAVVRGHGKLHADLLGLPPAEVEWVGRAALGPAPRTSIVGHEGQTDQGQLLALEGLVAMTVPDEVWERITILTPPAAQRRLVELAVELDTDDDLAAALRALADALDDASDSSRPLAEHVGQHPAPRHLTGELVSGRRVYEAAPPGVPMPPVAFGKFGRSLRVRPLADAEGRHVGYAAFDPLSREFRGRPLWAAYDLAGQLVGHLEEDEGGWRYYAGLPKGGFVTAPQTLAKSAVAEAMADDKKPSEESEGDSLEG